MMRDSISLLKDGIYEKVINRELAEALEAARENVWTKTEAMDPQEAVQYLSAYLKLLMGRCLKDIADSNASSELIEEVRLTNAMIDALCAHHPAVGEGQDVVDGESLLLSLEHRKNKLSERKWERPDTSMSRSFLFTNSQKDVNISSELCKEIATADRIDLLVSFIKFSGLSMIYPYLYDYTNRGGHLRVITTTYMGATDPKAVVRLASLPNTEVHISYNVKETRLHAKAYMFYRESGYSTAYVGSSNLSHAAIAEGLEWNMKVTAQDMPGIIDKMRATFETYWKSPDFERFSLDQEKKLWKEIDAIRHAGEGAAVNYSFDIHPYPYQRVILDALEADRLSKNQWRNLVVAATGTGKTAIAAFDYRRFAASRPGQVTKLLFIAHREEILKQSRDCFRQVLKDGNFGQLAVGNYHATDPSHLFMSIQTLQSSHFVEKMDPHFYDMIIVDEFHHAAAPSYQALLSHFHPKILLGLTATPERMDGKSVLTYFDNHIAAEIRLPDAVERRLLCPFHYFGTEDPIDLSHVSWKRGKYDEKELTNLYSINEYSANKRAEAICRAMERYTADMRDVKGIGFCVSQDHAHFMADYMNRQGITSIALDANSPDNLRQSAKTQLESGALHFIFVVDLFNEGVDIPSVNTVLFLRPTNSLTVFLQQLGRGLRLSKGKDCLTVLDFVAQSNRNYDFASRLTALLGKSVSNLKGEIKAGFPHAPRGCFIQLEKVAQKRILDNLNSRIRKNEYYKEQIHELYETTGTVPTLSEFLRAVGEEAGHFYNGKRSYARLCAEAGVIPDFSAPEEEILTKAFPRMLSIDSPRWIQFLLQQMEHPKDHFSPEEAQYLRMWQYTIYQKDYDACDMKDAGEIITHFQQIPALEKELRELLQYQFSEITLVYPKQMLPYPCALEVHARYTRDQLLAALGVKNPPSIREGVKYLSEKKTDVFLITLNKSAKEFSDTTLYEDYSISDRLFHWQSQSTTNVESPTGQRYIHQNQNGGTVLLFVRERKKDVYGNAMAYTFLGKAHYVSHEGSRPISIIYKLDAPIPAKYLTVTDSSGVL